MTAFLVVIVLFGALVSPEFVSNSVYNTIVICIKTIVPALFIYMVLTDYLVRKNVFRPVERILEPLGCSIGIGGAGVTVFLLGLLCGFPIGAKLSTALSEQNRISKKSAEYLNLFSNNCSLAFIFGVTSRIVGINGAWIIFLSQFFSAVIIAVVFRIILSIKKEQPSIILMAADTNSYEFTSSVVNNGITMLNICASVIVFAFFGDIVAAIIPDTIIPVKGIFEFSSGVIQCKSLDNNAALFATTLFCCFGGIAVYGQVASITRGKLSNRLYVPAKMLQAVIGCFIAWLLIICNEFFEEVNIVRILFH
ncbi:MAG: hypothetical protein A2Y17_11675 [Clostridiales bacterium GWF2_38_85]|nr:MAG: hypothetical protein A2Y17_11675 [Clostridiales bacterium GWF2_38_85]HBL85361.1 hypothetical protein [Clostridiales bacterium]